MLDMYGNPINGGRNSQWFFFCGSVAQTWLLPASATWIDFLLVGGGGGGGNGFSDIEGNPRGGGGGGSSGSITRIIIPRSIMPDRVYIFVGAGGAAGVNGLGSSVRLTDESNTRTFFASALGGLTGGNGSASGGGTAGTGNSAASATNHYFANWAVWTSLSGQSGNAGGAATGGTGTSVSWGLSGHFISGGAPGAGTQLTSFSGASVNGNGLMKVTVGGASNGASGGNGVLIARPLMASGGGGGSSNPTGAGGNGGNGSLGCGGGGGGGGTTGGTGGKGGDGFVVATWW